MYKIYLYFRDGIIPVRGCPLEFGTLKEARKMYGRYQHSSYDVELRNRNNHTLQWTNINWQKAR